VLQAEQHQPWLGSRIDLSVIDILRNRLAPPPKPKRGGHWMWIFFAIVLMQILLALANKN
jgi:hypothetical protein